MREERQRLVLDVWPGAADPEVGRWLSALAEVRRDTDRVLDQIAPEAIDADVGDGGDSLGTVLYHVALIEIDWVFTDALDREADIPVELFPNEHRELDGRLTPVTGETLASHRARLDRTRSMVMAALAPMSGEAFNQVHARASADVSASWVVLHLIEHEVEHRVRVSRIRDAFRH